MLASPLPYSPLPTLQRLQIQTIHTTQGGNTKRPAKAAAARPPLVPVHRPKPASLPKVVAATAPSQLGAAILAVRTAAGFSQTELAAKLKTAQANIARLEKAGSIPPLQRIAKTGHKLTITFTRHA